MQTSPLQYSNSSNNNNNLILNKNNFLAIDTPNSNNHSNILIHNKSSCNMMLTATSVASSPAPSMNYISKETINYA